MAGHVYFQTGDADAPDYIKDRNGEVVLGMCKLCRKAESELGPVCQANSFAERMTQHGLTIEEIPLTRKRESITGVIRPSDRELVTRAVANAKRPGYQKWAGVMDVFAVGSTSARALCVEFGHDPDKVTPRVCEEEE